VIWREYIVLAEGLAAQDSEASKRSAVSRAYYGAFNPAHHWLESHVGRIDRWATHKQVWDAFRSPDLASPGTLPKWEEVGQIGDSLRTLRNEADYDESMPGLDRHAPRSVADAERILSLLAELELAG
jgi:hypothetical protein